MGDADGLLKVIGTRAVLCVVPGKEIVSWAKR